MSKLSENFGSMVFNDTRRPDFDTLEKTLAPELGTVNFNYLVIQNNHFIERDKKN